MDRPRAGARRHRRPHGRRAAGRARGGRHRRLTGSTRKGRTPGLDAGWDAALRHVRVPGLATAQGGRRPRRVPPPGRPGPARRGIPEPGPAARRRPRLDHCGRHPHPDPPAPVRLGPTSEREPAPGRVSWAPALSYAHPRSRSTRGDLLRNPAGPGLRRRARLRLPDREEAVPGPALTPPPGKLRS
ncbi:hypothetical protein SGPA1_60073 [Streptomyces misionensis JCM 4497]